jgi:hypothetical protein
MKLTMKPTLFLAGALLSASSFLSAGTPTAVATDPVGYVTLTVNGSPDGVQAAFTPLAMSLENAAKANGSLTEAPTSSVITNSAAAYVTGEFGGVDASGNPTHYIQFADDGLIVDILDNTATSITTGTDLTGLVGTSARYVVKKHVTLADIFGVDNTAGLKSGGNLSASDLVYIMSSDGAGIYATYYYQTDNLGFLGGTGWRLNGDANTDTSNVIVGPDDGLIIARSDVGDLDIVVSGSVNVINHQRGLPNGFSLVSYPFPVDTTLDDSGIFTPTNGYVSGGNASASDLVYVLKSNGTFETYYRQTDTLGFLGGDGWRLNGDANTERGSSVSISAGSSVIIKHIGTGLLWADLKPF